MRGRDIIFAAFGNRVILLVALALVSIMPITAQKGGDPSQQAAGRACENRDFEGAIQIYDRMLRDYAGDSDLAARTLVQRGRAQELLGLTQAQAEYQKIIAEHGNEPIAAEASDKLSSIGPNLLRKPSIYIADLDFRSGTVGGPVRRLTNDCAIAEEIPTWSPDGKRIAFRTDGTGGRSAGPNANVVVQDLDTGRQKNFGRVSQAGPSLWFPDNKTLLTTGGDAGAGGTGEIVRLNVDTDNRISINRGLMLMPNTPLDFGSGGFNIGLTVLSPDGTTIHSFTVVTEGALATSNIWTFDASTGQQKGARSQVGKVPLRPTPLIVGPGHNIAISPDGRRLAVMRFATPESNITTVDLDGSNARIIAKDLGPFTGVAWAKNRIFFGRIVGEIPSASQRPTTLRNRIQIMQVPADGSSEPTFTGLEVDSLWSFDVSSDGAHIAFDGTDHRISSPTAALGAKSK